MNLLGHAKAFVRNTGGNFAMMLALVGLPVFGAIGVAIDYSRMSTARAELSDAVDAALLATTQDLTKGFVAAKDAEAAVRRYLKSNLMSKSIDEKKVKIRAIIVDRDTNKVTIDASAEVPMVILGVLGRMSETVAVTATSVYSDNNIEIAFALDVTGSMGGQKLNDLKAAASDALDIIMPATAPALPRIRSAMVPYSAQVNAGKYAKTASNNASTKCVSERTGPQAYTDAPPNGQPVGGDRSGGNGSFRCPETPVRALTADRAALKADVASFSAGGCTAGHIGVAWGYYMLSSRWNNVWETSARAASFGDKNTSKILILMTDGIFNTHYNAGASYNCWDDASSLTRAESEKYALALCDRMKKGGITVYTIAFNSPTAAQALMKKCASSPIGARQFFYNAKDGAQLREVFKEIAIDISSLRLVN